MSTMRGRIAVIGLCCGILGVVTIAVLSLAASRSVTLRSSGPLVAWLMEYGERARCERAPATWSLVGPEGATIWAYDGDTLRSHNPGAPPLSPALRDGLADADQAVELYGIGHGGVTAARTQAHGPCAIMTSQWRPVYRRGQLIGWFVLGGLVAGLLGAAISVIATQRPLHDLERAHAQIRDDAELIVRRGRELRDQIADVAHDVRTPIASLQLALEQAITAAGDPAAVEACLVRAVHDVVYVGGLVGNLALASELRAGTLTTTGTAVLGEIVERATLRTQFLARRRQIALEFAIPDAALWIDGDPVAIAQAVGNVIENAVAHGIDGGHVAVLLETVSPDAGSDAAAFELTIVDDGPGVPPGELPRLGERTFRSDAARRRDDRGRGLGLAITAEVCRRLKWQLAFANESPQGLRVTIRGPIRPGGRQ